MPLVFLCDPTPVIHHIVDDDRCPAQDVDVVPFHQGSEIRCMLMLQGSHFAVQGTKKPVFTCHDETLYLKNKLHPVQQA
jgi:hypothetical protein